MISIGLMPLVLSLILLMVFFVAMLGGLWLLLRKGQDQQRLQLSTDLLAQSEQLWERKQMAWRQQSSFDIEHLVRPLKENMQHLQQELKTTHEQQAVDRSSIHREIQQLAQLSQRLALESAKLSTVLKGDVKSQGKWGELILERVLEMAGLRRGQEYLLQAEGMALYDQQGKLQKPDAVILLPEGKHLLIDSKVSLQAYDAYLSALGNHDPEQAGRHLKKMLESFHQHVLELSKKSYQENQQLNTPDVVLLFVPVEGALALALEQDPSLMQKAWEKSLLLVGPTTLLGTLKTVALLWQKERQSRNALEIALEAGKMYDKVVSFLQDWQRVGEQLAKTKDLHAESAQKLSGGRGSVVAKLETLKVLGVKATRSLPAEFAKTDGAELGT